MSAQPYETIESLVPRSWVKRMDALAKRNGVGVSDIVAQAVAQFLLDHKKLKGSRK